jgi:hypothetical protein
VQSRAIVDLHSGPRCIGTHVIALLV